MKKIIRFVSRWDFKKLLKNNELGNASVISVNDTDYEMKEIQQHIAFHGFDPDKAFLVNFPDNDKGIDSYAAGKLVDFIKNQGNTDFIVHCFMGVSRSGAIAKFINEYYDMNDVVLNDYKGYNKQVFNSLNAVIGNDLATYYAELEAKDRGSFSQ